MSEEKTEQPTDKKLEDAKEKGQVAVSRDLVHVALLGTMGEMAFITEPLWRNAIESLLDLSFMRIGKPFLPAVGEMFMSAGLLLFAVFGACAILCTVVSIVAFWGQFGVVISTESITPNFDKLNPVNGIKQIFSKRKLMELLLTMFKGVFLGWIIFLMIRTELPNMLQLSNGTPKDIYAGFITVLRAIFHVAVLVCLCLAVVDFAVQKHAHIKSLMMDMEEIKREYKESEGDPMIKSQRKQLAREWAMSGPPEKTQDANAVVVNPTHFAVALRYDPEDAPVPVVVTKGKDDIAQAIIRRARECGIPVIRHVWLARTLYATCREDMVVPKSSYEAVAHVYAVVHELYAQDKTGMSIELENYGDPPESYRQ